MFMKSAGMCAGKLMHAGAAQLSGSEYSLLDCNRAGVPLLEVVSEPDMRDGAEAAAYAAELRRVVLFMGLTDGVMADGHLRFDVNVSVRAPAALLLLLLLLLFIICYLFISRTPNVGALQEGLLHGGRAQGGPQPTSLRMRCCRQVQTS